MASSSQKSILDFEGRAGDGAHSYGQLFVMVKGAFPHMDDLMIVASVEEYLKKREEEEEGAESPPPQSA
eukprot:199652-Pleurochrysis_carterae.AAC.1